LSIPIEEVGKASYEKVLAFSLPLCMEKIDSSMPTSFWVKKNFRD